MFRLQSIVDSSCCGTRYVLAEYDTIGPWRRIQQLQLAVRVRVAIGARGSSVLLHCSIHRHAWQGAVTMVISPSGVGFDISADRQSERAREISDSEPDRYSLLTSLHSVPSQKAEQRRCWCCAFCKVLSVSAAQLPSLPLRSPVPLCLKTQCKNITLPHSLRGCLR